MGLENTAKFGGMGEVVMVAIVVFVIAGVIFALLCCPRKDKP